MNQDLLRDFRLNNKLVVKIFTIITVTILMIISLTGCSGSDNRNNSGLKGTVRGDGSSTVYPITEAVAEEFQIATGVRVTVGLSGTGGGFKKFASGEIDFTNASREIKNDEATLARKNGIEYLELEVAYDGLSILVNPTNKFVTDLTVAELNKIWKPGSKVKTWKDVRSEWPAEKIQLFGPGTDSGTFDYFTKAINGEEQASRADYTASEDDNMLVQGIAGNKYALGYMGYSYYFENKGMLKLVSVEKVYPSSNTIKKGKYKPLSRPLYIYVNKNSLKKPAVKAFVKFYMENGALLSADVGYIPLPDKEYKKALGQL